MNTEDIIRCWKDPEFRSGLSAAQLQGMPEHPAGPMDGIRAAVGNTSDAVDDEEPTVDCTMGPCSCPSTEWPFCC